MAVAPEVHLSPTSVRAKSIQCVCLKAKHPINMDNLRLEYVPKAPFVASRGCDGKTAVLDGYRVSVRLVRPLRRKGQSYIIEQRADAEE